MKLPMLIIMIVNNFAMILDYYSLDCITQNILHFQLI